MTSERRLAANRKNAKRSTGPRTARGKLRVRSNAVQHGLATTALRHPALAIEVQRIAKAICAGSKSQLQFDRALSIAESELMLTKVRSTRFGALRLLSSIAAAGKDPVAASSEAPAHMDMGDDRPHPQTSSALPPRGSGATTTMMCWRTGKSSDLRIVRHSTGRSASLKASSC